MEIREVNFEIQKHVEILEAALKNLRGGNLADFPERLNEFSDKLVDLQIWQWKNSECFKNQ